MNQSDYIQRLYDDPAFFAREIWRELNLDRHGEISEVDADMIRHALLPPSAGGYKKTVTIGTRGVGKTYTIVCVGTCWDLFRDPEAKIMIVSKSTSHAKKTLKMIQEWIIKVPFLQHLAAVDMPPRRWSALELDVATCRLDRTPSVVACGIESQLPGSRAHRIYPDDVETGENTGTLSARDDLEEKVKEFVAIATYGEGLITYVGTYWHPDSIYRKLAQRRDGEDNQMYHLRSYPIRVPTAEEMKGIINLAPIIAEMGVAKGPTDIMPVFPHRFSRAKIMEFASEGKQWFGQQCMCLADPTGGSGYPLQLYNLIVFEAMDRDQAPATIAWGKYDEHGKTTAIEDIPSYGVLQGDRCHRAIMHSQDWLPYEGTKMVIDPSGRGNDKTGYAIGSALNGYVWVKAIGGIGGDGTGSEALQHLAYLARLHNVTEIRVFPTGGYGSVVELLRPVIQSYYLEEGKDSSYPNGWKCSVDYYEGAESGRKERRIIASIDAPLHNHRLVISRSVALNSSFQKQFANIRDEPGCLPHDDEIDAFAGLVRLWKPAIGIDPERAAEYAVKRRKDELIRKWWEDELGVTVRGDSWIKR